MAEGRIQGNKILLHSGFYLSKLLRNRQDTRKLDLYGCGVISDYFLTISGVFYYSGSCLCLFGEEPQNLRCPKNPHTLAKGAPPRELSHKSNIVDRKRSMGGVMGIAHALAQIVRSEGPLI